jgi:preprotein translocase subunit SecY
MNPSSRGSFPIYTVKGSFVRYLTSMKMVRNKRRRALERRDEAGRSFVFQYCMYTSIILILVQAGLEVLGGKANK